MQQQNSSTYVYFNTNLQVQPPPPHITSFSLQHRRKRKLNPINAAQQRRISYPLGCLQIPSCHGPESFYLYLQPPAPSSFSLENEQCKILQDLQTQALRDKTRRKQLEDSLPFRRNQRMKKRANIYYKKVKRLQRGLLRSQKHSFWKSEKNEEDEIRKERKIIRRKRANIMSSPEECKLWNCPRKLKRKGLLARRYPKPEGSISSIRSQRSRSRTPIMHLRDTPLHSN